MKNAASTVAIASLMTGLALAQAATRPQATVDRSQEPKLVKFQDLKWEKLWDRPCNDKGEYTEIAFSRIDPTTGATDLMIRNPAKCYVRRHWHHANERIYVLSGTFVLECEGKQEELGPGSTGYVPAKMLHRAWTKPNEGALYFIHVDTAWDTNLAQDPGQPPWAQ